MTPPRRLLCVGAWNGAAWYVRYRCSVGWWDCLKWRTEEGWQVVYHQPKDVYADA